MNVILPRQDSLALVQRHWAWLALSSVLACAQATPQEPDERDAAEVRDGGTDARARMDGTVAPTSDGATPSEDPPDAGELIDARMPDARADARADSGATDASVSDAGEVRCKQGWTRKDGACVPPCLALPGAFEDVMPSSSAPPFGNTVWFDPDIITDKDPTSFVEAVPTGRGQRQVFDRRTSSFVTINAILFRARFGTSTEVEVQVNPEFSQAEAQAAANRHALAVGRVPAFLFARLKSITIHAGKQLYGGGNENLLIHTEQTDDYEADGVLEETLVHELTHTSIDPVHAQAANWRAAQQADGRAISPYARDNPSREDVSETMGPYLAVRFRPERLTPDAVTKFEAALPNRTRYLDCLGLSLEPPK